MTDNEKENLSKKEGLIPLINVFRTRSDRIDEQQTGAFRTAGDMDEAARPTSGKIDELAMAEDIPLVLHLLGEEERTIFQHDAQEGELPRYILRNRAVRQFPDKLSTVGISSSEKSFCDVGISANSTHQIRTDFEDHGASRQAGGSVTAQRTRGYLRH